MIQRYRLAEMKNAFSSSSPVSPSSSALQQSVFPAGGGSVSPALARRLPAYFRILIRFYGSGKMRISSEELAGELRLTPSQVRADLRAIGCQGQRSYGYGIAALYKRLADIFQLSDKFSAVTVGSAPLAGAIADTPVFAKRGVKLKARFADAGEEAAGDLLPFSEFYEFIVKNRPHIIVTAGCSEGAAAALEVTERALCCAPEDKKRVSPYGADDFCEVWNFTDAELFSSKLTVKNIHLSDALMLLCLEAGGGRNV